MAPKRSGGPTGRPRPVQDALNQAGKLMSRGRYPAAVQVLETALRLAPRDPELLHLLGSAQLASGEVEASIRLLRKAVKLAPKTAVFSYHLGNALLTDDRLNDALNAYRAAVRADADLAEAHTNAGLILIRLRRFDEAMAAFRHALRVAPEVPQHHYNLALCQYQSGRQRDAARTLAAARSAPVPLDAAFWTEAARMLANMQRFEQAEAAARDALALSPRHAPAWVALAEALEGLHRPDDAIEAYRRAGELGLAPGERDARIAEALSNAGIKTRALEQVERNVVDHPTDQTVLKSAARILSRFGKYDRQEALLRRVLDIDPDQIDAVNQLLSVPGRRLDTAEVERLARLVSDEDRPADARSLLGFSLGRHYQEQGDHQRAFSFYQLGNRLKGLHYDRAGMERWTRATLDSFDAAFFDARRDWGVASRRPLLIVGMPRSGTTLIEQIISAHPAVFGAGELGALPDLAATADADLVELREHPAGIARLDAAQVRVHADRYLEQLASVAPDDCLHVSNKYPANFRYLGLFALLYPDAPIIHLQRDPRDTLVSIYFHDFVGAHEYAYDLKALTHYYGQYRRLMAHWRTLLPNPLLEIRYEDVVADLPAAARRLADFIGVPWDESMLAFYDQDRDVRTASHWQVRQPIYSKAVGRWQHYRQQLAPMLRELDKAGFVDAGPGD